MTPKDYLTTGALFDLLNMKFKYCDTTDEEKDERYKKENEDLEKLLEKTVKGPAKLVTTLLRCLIFRSSSLFPKVNSPYPFQH